MGNGEQKLGCVAGMIVWVGETKVRVCGWDVCLGLGKQKLGCVGGMIVWVWGR